MENGREELREKGEGRRRRRREGLQRLWEGSRRGCIVADLGGSRRRADGGKKRDRRPVEALEGQRLPKGSVRPLYCYQGPWKARGALRSFQLNRGFGLYFIFFVLSGEVGNGTSLFFFLFFLIFG